MERITPEQRLQIVQFYYENSRSVKNVFRAHSTFSSQILFCDEAHLWLNGYVNKQNCRIWNEEQPEEIQELPLHPKKQRFGVVCGPVESSVHISSKMMPVRT